MKRLQYSTDIQSPAAKVSEIMLGRDTYRLWTAAFNPTSDFEGGWAKGDKIYFTGISKEGKKEGMVAEIAEHIPGRFVSIRHYGILDGDQEITEGEQVEKMGRRTGELYFRGKGWCNHCYGRCGCDGRAYGLLQRYLSQSFGQTESAL